MAVLGCRACSRKHLPEGGRHGFGTCILGAIARDAIRRFLDIPDSKQIQAAIGVGVPAHEPHLEESESGEIEYWMDPDGDLHVPKKKLENMLRYNKL